MDCPGSRTRQPRSGQSKIRIPPGIGRKDGVGPSEKRACQRINTTKIEIALSKCLVPHPRIASLIKQLGAISAPAEQRNQHRLSTKSARLAGSGNNGIEPHACPPLTSLQAGAGRVGAVNDCRPSVDNEVDCCKPAPCAVSRAANPATPKPAARFGEARDIAERGARRECQPHRERAAASERLEPIMRRPHENDLIGHMLRDHSRGRHGRIDAILESPCVIWRHGGAFYPGGRAGCTADGPRSTASRPADLASRGTLVYWLPSASGRSPDRDAAVAQW